ncbi:N-acetylglutamate synthase-like GNAT family acetyltransferase [Alkalihalobacillus xiaoxiensis]|uniref:N-acetylglutamate synthase-like GNAT family acetyltransferase n=1 Tax=Shouchella xiaoxiensis TaxID=766895 RepID=A0ABS2SUW9_9BACI|nr:GNAT family N-acetyltransferase [Shouchella xiaoxiensis]MBM7839320.1 N-acetylglutamate synthase-like GNAT family acetyltransferase [Shouchella xiaoxiensis]
MTIEIKEATLQDARAILELQKIAYQSEAELYKDYSILPLHETVEDVERAFTKNVVLKAVSNENKIVGSVRAMRESDTTKIGKLMVHPSWQDQGLGRKLMDAIEETVESSVYALFTGSKSEKNLAFYQKLGYKTIKLDTLPGEATVFAFMEKTVSSK